MCVSTWLLWVSLVDALQPRVTVTSLHSQVWSAHLTWVFWLLSSWTYHRKSSEVDMLQYRVTSWVFNIKIGFVEYQAEFFGGRNHWHVLGLYQFVCCKSVTTLPDVACICDLYVISSSTVQWVRYELFTVGSNCVDIVCSHLKFRGHGTAVVLFLIPRLLKLSDQYNLNGPGNLGNLGSKNEIHLESHSKQSMRCKTIVSTLVVNRSSLLAFDMYTETLLSISKLTILCMRMFHNLYQSNHLSTLNIFWVLERLDVTCIFIFRSPFMRTFKRQISLWGRVFIGNHLCIDVFI